MKKSRKRLVLLPFAYGKAPINREGTSMIFSILHFLGGYCKVVLSGGGQERFLNICVSKQILLWKLTRKDSHYIFFISRAGMEELEEISAKTGCSYRVICKKGLPFLFHRYRKRKILLAAFLFSAVSLYVMSLFLWQIQAVGCRSHSEEEILDYLEEQGIKSGRRLSEISCHALEEQIRRDYKDIAWVSCDLKGTLLTVTIKETLDKEAVQAETADVPCNLIAAKKGTIDSIVVRSGSAMVKKGDKVKRGDVLISGEVGLYDDSGTLTETALVKAEGSILAITKIKYEDSFSMLHYVKKHTGRSFDLFQILAGEKLISLPGKKETYRYYDEETKQHILHIGPQLYLPLSLYVTTRSECQIQEKTYTEEQAVKEAEKRLSVFLQEYKEQGVEIIDNKVRITCGEGVCRAKGKIIVREPFGKIQEISQ